MDENPAKNNAKQLILYVLSIFINVFRPPYCRRIPGFPAKSARMSGWAKKRTCF
jgi:hypothetical protein